MKLSSSDIIIINFKENYFSQKGEKETHISAVKDDAILGLQLVCSRHFTFVTNFIYYILFFWLC